MSETIELVRFTVKADQRDRFLAERPAAIAAIRDAFPELIDAVLSEREDGSWLDVVRWDSVAGAEKAAAGCRDIPAVRAWMEAIDQVQELSHASVRHRLA